MNIFIDESGSFVSAARGGSWNAVAALALPETFRRDLEKLVKSLGMTVRPGSTEIKLNDLTESQYLDFLSRLGKLDGSLFCIATDAGLNSVDTVVKHQKMQVFKILEHIDKMKYEGGRKGSELLAAQVGKLSPQLYVQLFCQLDLMYQVISRAITYYAQRNPGTLSAFRWRIDQKDIEHNNFENAFEKLSPAILQTMSLDSPLLMVRGFDYSKLKRYIYLPGEGPTYLSDTYGLANTGDGALNLQMLVREDMQFLDSKDSKGIQAIDLVVSGIRRCLRKGFVNNEQVALLLGRLMVQAAQGQPPFKLVSFGEDAPLDSGTASLVKIMRDNAKPMIFRR